MGRAGERKAEKFLKKTGYKILEKNYKSHFGEIDLIAQKDDEIVFVEVKTRTSIEYGYGSEAVNAKKRDKYYLIAAEYLQKNRKTDFPCRFDVIEINDGKINHIQNAFYK